MAEKPCPLPPGLSGKPLPDKDLRYLPRLARNMHDVAALPLPEPTMSPSDSALVRKLVIAVILKLLVLLALWWAFIREQRVEVDGRAAAAHVLGTPHNDDKE